MIPARFKASLITILPNCGAVKELKAPLNTPIGDRQALAITTSLNSIISIYPVQISIIIHLQEYRNAAIETPTH